MQALLAAHAVGHLDDDGDIQCDVCLVGHGMGHTLPTSPLVLAAPKPQRRECIKQKDAATSAAPPTPCQRGPPEQLRFA